MLKETLNWGPERGLENCCNITYIVIITINMLGNMISDAENNMLQNTKTYMTVKHFAI
jgi:hypothetical protein